jgi:protein-disulfide isomerase
MANFGLLASLWFLLGRQDTAGSSRLFRSKSLSLGLAALAVVTGALIEGVLWTPSAQARKATAAYEAAPRVSVPIRPSDPVLGPQDAPVKMVIFSSFQCPACKGFARAVPLLHQQYPNELAIVFKNFPLDTTCNPSMRRQMQPRACATALAAQAANHQNAFWQYHDMVFGSNLRENEADLGTFAASAGVDPSRWDADRQSAQAKTAVNDDVQDGIRLGLDRTPSIFLDGRLVTNFSYPVLQSLIEHEVEANGNGSK